MTVTILRGDCREVLRTLPDESVHCGVTSPPYWGLRDYGTEGQIGLEQTYLEHVEEMTAVFREVRRVLRKGSAQKTIKLQLTERCVGDTLRVGLGSHHGCLQPRELRTVEGTLLSKPEVLRALLRQD